jgi:phenylalanine-4-hydroxylase
LLGKVKTAAVMSGSALALLLQGLALGGLFELTGGVITFLEVLSHLVRVALWVAAAAALVSAAQYFSALKASSAS